MRYFLIVGLLLALTACGGKGGGTAQQTGSNTGVQPARGSGESVALEITSVAHGSDSRLVLAAPAAADLYQIAGSLTYDSGKYEVLAIEAAGGLGGPQDAFFLGEERLAGKIDFAYTKMAHGPGVSGNVALISILVRERSGARGLARASDFALATGAGELLVRDSQKRALTVSFGGAR